jgi:hypothetical protein
MGGAVECWAGFEAREMVLSAERVEVEGGCGGEGREHGGEAEVKGNAGAHREGS